MSNARVDALVLGAMKQGKAPSQIDRENKWPEGHARDIMVDMWADDKERMNAGRLAKAYLVIGGAK